MAAKKRASKVAKKPKDFLEEVVAERTEKDPNFPTRMDLAKLQAEIVSVRARGLVTIDLEDEAWNPEWEDRPLSPALKRIREGSIVRLRPPATATDGRVNDVRKLCEERGAERVTVLPRLQANPLPERIMKAPVRTEDLRATVLALVEESTGNAKDDLRAFVTEVMDEEGI